MAERKFDYNSVGTVYNQMKSINDNIKTIINDTNTHVHERVDVCDEAVYGDLGNQLLLSWENISSDFPAFIDNFENWSALVAKASGDYSQFEADVSAFKNANPLGVTSAGAQYGAVATSDYNNTFTTEEIANLDAYTVFYEPTGATYIDTGMVEFAKKHKVYNIVTDALNIANLAACGIGAFKIAKGGAAFLKSGVGAGKLTVHQTLKGQAVRAAKGLTGIKYATKYAGTYAKILLKGGKTSAKIATGFWKSIGDAAKGAGAIAAAGAGAGIMSDIVYKTGAEYQADKYMTGSAASLRAGQGVVINNQDYCYIGSTPGGQRLFTDTNGKIHYMDQNQNVVAVNVTNSNGQTSAATIETMDENFTMNVGGETITQNTTLSKYDSANYRNIVSNANQYMDSIYERIGQNANQ